MADQEPALIQGIEPGRERQPAARDRVVDALRGLAMVGVVVIHWSDWARAHQDWAQAAQIADHAGRFGVPWFIAVLGLMTARARATADYGWPWLKRRLLVIALPYLVWAGVCAVAAPPQPLPWRLDEPWATALAVPLGYTSAQFWYMPAYLSLVLAVPGIAAVARRLGSRGTRALMIALITLQVAMLYGLQSVNAVDAPPPLWAKPLLLGEGRIPLQWLGFFAVGWLLADPGWLLARTRAVDGGRIVVGVALHGWIALREPVAPRFDDFWCSPAIFWIFMAFLLWAPPLMARLIATSPIRWLQQIGRQSLPIYLSHVLWITLAAKGLQVVADHLAAQGEALSPLPQLLAIVAATILGSWLYVRIHPRIFAT